MSLRSSPGKLLLRRCLATAPLILALAACGQGQTFGFAPGPPPPDPPPPPPPADAGYTPPPADAGYTPPPQDAGPNCTTQSRAATPAENLTEFNTQGLPGEFACASCHLAKSPSGSGIGWGPANNPAADADWHAAVIDLADRQSASAPTATTLYTHFDGSDGTHPQDDVAKAAFTNWLDLHRNGVLETVCEEPEPEPCPPTYRDPTPAESEANFNTTSMAADFACASCHNSGTPDQSGISWGPGNPADWHAASVALAERDAALAVNQNALYTHFDGSDATHPQDVAKRDRMSAWLTYRRTQIEEPGVCDDPDPDEPDCTPIPVDVAGSETEFSTRDLGTPYGCASCHVGKSPTGTGLNWGPTSSNPVAADWHEAAYALEQRDAALDVEDTALYTHFDGANATHPATPAARDNLGGWLDYIRSPQPPAGCE
jgi:hypothetical protein